MQHRDLAALRQVRWRITLLDLVGVDEHRLRLRGGCFFFFASLPRAAGAAVSKARAISDDSVLVFIETSLCVGQSGSRSRINGSISGSLPRAHDARALR